MRSKSGAQDSRLLRVVLLLFMTLLVCEAASAGCPIILIDPKTPNTIFLGFSDVAVYKSANNATSWEPIGLYQIPLGELAIDPQNPMTLYAGTYYGVAKTTDGGKNWKESGLSESNIDALVLDPQTPSTVFARASKDPVHGWPGAVFKSIDGGATWSDANTGLPEKGVLSLRINPRDPNILYAGTERGIFKTTNGGKSWTASNAGLTKTEVHALAIDNQKPDILYVSSSDSSGSGVYKSTNGGQTWSQANAGLPAVPVFDLTLDPTHPLTIYAGTAGKGLYKSTDGGLTWASVGPTNSYLCGIVVDPRNPLVLYAGTTGDSSVGYSTEVLKSTDGGVRWALVSRGLPTSFTIQ